MDDFFDEHPIIWGTLMVLGTIVLVSGLTILFAMMEAEAYRRLTGKQVSTWDAIWLDLRIQEQVR